MEQKDFAGVGGDILSAARNELYMNLPYLDTALCALALAPGGGVTVSLATDGETLYYDGAWLSERYLRSHVCPWPPTARRCTMTGRGCRSAISGATSGPAGPTST